MRSEN
jgi:hypothetical protein